MAENGYAYAWPARFWYPVYFGAAWLSSKSALVQTKMARIGEIADWIRYVERHVAGGEVRVFSDKDKLRLAILRMLDKDSSISIVELGVAYGRGSSWWLKWGSQQLNRLHGFDRFTGLPREWRGLSAGHFSTSGQPPAIDSEKVKFWIGDVEETIPQALADAEFRSDLQDSSTIFVFDMDIREPTEFAYSALLDLMSPGDVLLFDEAFDAANERVVLEQALHDWEYECLGVTCEAVAMKLLGRTN